MKKKTPFKILGQSGKLPSGRYWQEADGDLMISKKGKQEDWKWYYKCYFELEQEDLTAIKELDEILNDEVDQLRYEAYTASTEWIKKLTDQGRLSPLGKLSYQDFMEESKKIKDPDIYNEDALYMDYSVIKEDFIDCALEIAWELMENAVDDNW